VYACERLREREGEGEGERLQQLKMAISGDLRVSATLASYSKHPPRCSLPPSNSKVSTPLPCYLVKLSLFSCVFSVVLPILCQFICLVKEFEKCKGK
jgi:hypothetical protein